VDLINLGPLRKKEVYYNPIIRIKGITIYFEYVEALDTTKHATTLAKDKEEICVYSLNILNQEILFFAKQNQEFLRHTAAWSLIFVTMIERVRT
jgi:hypothetical protein